MFTVKMTKFTANKTKFNLQTFTRLSQGRLFYFSMTFKHPGLISENLKLWLVRYLMTAGLMRATPPWLWFPLPVITDR